MRCLRLRLATDFSRSRRTWASSRAAAARSSSKDGNPEAARRRFSRSWSRSAVRSPASDPGAGNHRSWQSVWPKFHRLLVSQYSSTPNGKVPPDTT